MKKQKPHTITNSQIASLFARMAVYLAMDEVPFKPQAYEKAAESIAGFPNEIASVYEAGGEKALRKIPGVGAGIAQRIEELLKTGKMADYEKYRKRYPVKLEELASIEGLGPKTIKTLYKKLKIKGIADLERAIKAGKLRKLPHFGERSEEKLKQGVLFFKGSHKRFVLGWVLAKIRKMQEELRNLPGVEQAEIAGSARRWEETVGDLDFLVASTKPKVAIDFFASMPDVVHVYGKGATKVLVRLSNGMDADLRVIHPESFGTALQYFTGNKEHNIVLRKIAQEKGLKLNEYGLFREKKMLAGRTEEEVYRALGLAWMPPELRQNKGELAEARRQAQSKPDGVPKLIGWKDLTGDLQVQTDWTDGKDSIYDMAQAAKQAGLTYILITDHTRALAMTGGSDEKKLRRQMVEIEKINAKFSAQGGQKSKFKILKGAEVNILKDGSLDIKDEVLAELDLVGVAVHSHFTMPKAEMTERLLRAIRNPHVDMFFHPTTRIIQRRGMIEFDHDAVFREAAKRGVALEINAWPERLDLKDELIREAKSVGAKFVINSDAHSVRHFQYLELGVAQARRGWLEKKDVINTLTLEKLLAWKKRKTRSL